MADGIESRKDAHLGQGIAYPLRMNVQGGLQLSTTLHNIEESIQIILRTNLGERVYRPNFGSRLSELVFAPMNTQTLLLIQLYVEEALEMWEPRIEVDNVSADPDQEAGRVNITIQYHPLNSPDSRSMVYPFYLTPAGEGEA